MRAPQRPFSVLLLPLGGLQARKADRRVDTLPRGYHRAPRRTPPTATATRLISRGRSRRIWGLQKDDDEFAGGVAVTVPGEPHGAAGLDRPERAAASVRVGEAPWWCWTAARPSAATTRSSSRRGPARRAAHDHPRAGGGAGLLPASSSAAAAATTAGHLPPQQPTAAGDFRRWCHRSSSSRAAAGTPRPRRAGRTAAGEPLLVQGPHLPLPLPRRQRCRRRGDCGAGDYSMSALDLPTLASMPPPVLAEGLSHFSQWELPRSPPCGVAVFGSSPRSPSASATSPACTRSVPLGRRRRRRQRKRNAPRRTRALLFLFLFHLFPLVFSQHRLHRNLTAALSSSSSSPLLSSSAATDAPPAGASPLRATADMDVELGFTARFMRRLRASKPSGRVPTGPVFYGYPRPRRRRHGPRGGRG